MITQEASGLTPEQYEVCLKFAKDKLKWNNEGELLLPTRLEQTIDYAKTFLRAPDEEDLRRAVGGLFHPDNQNTRALFVAMTGKALPKSVKGTWEVIKEHYGQALTDYLNARNEERLKKQQDKAAKELEKTTARLDEIKTRVIADQFITGTELAELCRHLRVNAPARSVGMWRESIKQVNSQEAQVVRSPSKRSVRSVSAFQAYYACRRELTTPEEPCDPVVERLFNPAAK